jgi:sec-independent protein translocase protein TatB
MFDIGWSEMLIIGAVALIVIGPKELPGALKTFAYWMKQARKLAREFHSGVDDMIRQAELDEAKKAVEDARRTLNREVEAAVDPTGEVKQALSASAISTPTPSISGSSSKSTGNGSATPAGAKPLPKVEQPSAEGTAILPGAVAPVAPEKAG